MIHTFVHKYNIGVSLQEEALVALLYIVLINLSRVCLRTGLKCIYRHGGRGGFVLSSFSKLVSELIMPIVLFLLFHK